MKKLFSWIDRTPNDAAPATRFYAYLIDWVVGGILCALPAVLMYGGLTKRNDVFTDLYVFPALGFDRAWSYLAGGLCIAAAIIYFVYIPWKKNPGQTFGKKIMKIKVVNNDGSTASFRSLFIREFVGMMIVESGAIVVGAYFRQIATLLLSYDVDYWWQLIGNFLLIVSGILVFSTASHRALHDYLAGTKVIQAQV